MTKIVELINVAKTFQLGQHRVNALQDINLHINQGEFVAIVGPSGSGKTTLAQIIGGLATPSSGTVTINNQNISQFNDKDLSYFRNKNIGFVFQNFGLLPQYTVVENVMIPLFVAGFNADERMQKAKHYLNMVGLNLKENDLTKTLSGGQRQRVAIARALVMEPQIIIADEPTGNLDSANGQKIIQILKGLSKNKITVIIVTHDAKLAAASDRQIHIKDGVIDESN